MEVDNHREEIYQLYITQRKPLKEVVRHLQEIHGLEIKPRALEKKLDRWGYKRNISRSQAFALLRAASNAKDDGKQPNDQQLQPARAAKLEQYLRRNKLGALVKSMVLPSLPQPQVWRIPEQIFFENVAIITSSFESSSWTSAGNELIIQSSTKQDTEKEALHSFLAHLEMATKAASSGEPQTAGEHWIRAFETVDTLVTGQYHDILPNILQKINDLKAEGHPEVATKLKNYLAEASAVYKVRGPMSAIFKALNLVHLDDMADIEERIMQTFVNTFDRFLGLLHYNSFVMRMNLARRHLLRSSQASLEDYIPSLTLFDRLFSPGDTRSLDIIRLRTEILHHRGDYERVESEAQLLVQRAGLKRHDVWQRLYFLIKGYYFLSLSQNQLGKQDMARMNMAQGIRFIAEFSRIDLYGIFNSEKAVLEDCLREA
ncbi:MAG: hypothetical protein M1829_005366 [Trizodia sp. TS-e1964]|nr:MAG: hypothetical protein M1829_005366 [Trizodia sp. TS-e1964]